MRACVCSYVQVLLEARDIRSSGARIAGSCEHPVRVLGSEFSPWKQCVLLTIEPRALNRWATQMFDKFISPAPIISL